MGTRTYPKQPRAYVDMDGPAADFELAAALANKTCEELKLTKGTYLSLPLTASSQQAISELEQMGYLVFFLTKIPRLNAFAATEKLLWVKEHFPQVGERVIISPDKGALGRVGDILIDDHPEWANCSEFGGKIIKFELDKGWAETTNQAREAIAEIRQKVQPKV